MGLQATLLAALGAAALLAPLTAASSSAASASDARSTAEVNSAARQESVDDLLREGRRLLAQNKVAEAVARFERAFELDAGAVRSKVWLVRGWIAQGSHQDALGGVDELRAEKAPAADVDYLFGLAMLGHTKASLSSGGNAFTQSQFLDAAAALQRATNADAERYSDAFLPLVEAAWYAQDLPLARAAADRAVEREPTSPQAHTLRGRVVFSQYSGEADETQKKLHWQAAAAAFEAAVKHFGAPTDPWLRGQLADAHIQLGHLHVFAEDKAKASEHYAAAIGWDPSKVDFGAVRGALGAELLPTCLAQGEKRFLGAHEATDPMYSTLSWWLGFTHFENAKWPECETAFRRAVALWPGYANSWYYVFRATFSQQKYAEALEALRAYESAAPEGLIESLAGQKGLNVQCLEYLVGWCANPGNHDGRAQNLDAAFLSDVLTRLEPEVSRFWNNLGLFVRDHGDALRWSRSPEATKEKLEVLWKRALVAYERALELEPENPNYLNDTAVMFHYYLERDYEKALAMYEKAAVLADQLLARKDLAPDVREVVKIAQRDSKNNTVKLKRLMEKLARGEKPGPEDANN
jgi:tetratricopeptide (TPR) repeat protein